MIFVRKRKLVEVIKILESDSCNQSKASGDTEKERENDFYWRCGNANAVNFIKYKLNL